MTKDKEKLVAVKEKKELGPEFLEIFVGEDEKGRYITLPLSYDFEFSPVDEKGIGLSVSSIAIHGTRTVIKTFGSTSQWRLKVMRSKDLSSVDPTGTTSPPDGDESGDGFVDWLRGQTVNMDEK
jgi:hypothetical protein